MIQGNSQVSSASVVDNRGCGNVDNRGGAQSCLVGAFAAVMKGLGLLTLSDQRRTGRHWTVRPGKPERATCRAGQRGRRPALPLITCFVNNALRYHECVLRSFRDKDTEAIWYRQRSRTLDGPVQRVAWRKLAMLDAAETLTDLLIPPGNRLEKLTGDRAGQYSIRINQQWRICFVWSDAGPEDVEIVDYH
jgi:proteic killer suppression protein